MEFAGIRPYSTYIRKKSNTTEFDPHSTKFDLAKSRWVKPASHRQDMAQDTARTCHDQEFRSENSFNS